MFIMKKVGEIFHLPHLRVKSSQDENSQPAHRSCFYKKDYLK